MVNIPNIWKTSQRFPQYLSRVLSRQISTKGHLFNQLHNSLGKKCTAAYIGIICVGDDTIKCVLYKNGWYIFNVIAKSCRILIGCCGLGTFQTLLMMYPCKKNPKLLSLMFLEAILKHQYVLLIFLNTLH